MFVIFNKLLLKTLRQYKLSHIRPQGTGRGGFPQASGADPLCKMVLYLQTPHAHPSGIKWSLDFPQHTLCCKCLVSDYTVLFREHWQETPRTDVLFVVVVCV